MAIQGVAVTQGIRDHAFVVGTGPTMRSFERMMADIACTDIPVLVAGESGTGKEEVAVRIPSPGVPDEVVEGFEVLRGEAFDGRELLGGGGAEVLEGREALRDLPGLLGREAGENS